MRNVLPSLLLLLFVVCCPVTSSRESRVHAPRLRYLQLHKRQDVQTTKRLLEFEVPDHLKKFKIFQDGNRVREGIRNGYIGFLRRIDKVREPYSFAKGIKKEWVYKPDLRKHYVLPRVLRIPAIIQKGPVPYEDEFAAYIKSADDDLNLKEVARAQVPELAEKLKSDSTESSAKATAEPSSEAPAAKSSSEVQPPVKSIPRRPKKGRRRPPKYSRKTSFSFAHFEQARDVDQSPLRQSLSELDSDEVPQPSHVVESQSAPPQDASNPEALPSTVLPKSELEASQDSPVIQLTTRLMSMAERYKVVKKFQEDQLKKAAVRYVGHSEYQPPAQVDVAAEGAGLAPIHVKVQNPQEVSPDPTPRRYDYPEEVDADVSNPQTPRYHTPVIHGFTGTMTPDTPILRSESPESPVIRTPAGYLSPGSPSPWGVSPGRPSPLVSTPGGSTPRSRISTGTNTPITFRLPSHYADLLQATRLRPGSDHLRSRVTAPSVARQEEFEPGIGARVSTGWYSGRPSQDGIQSVREMAEMNDADYAIYDDDVLQRHELPTRFTKTSPFDQDEERSLSSLAGKGRVGSSPDSAELSARRHSDPHSSVPGSAGSSLPVSPSLEDGIQSQDAASSSQLVSVGQTANFNHETDNAFLDGRSSQAAAKKLTQPLTLNKPAHSFGFPPTEAELITPHLGGFKPSLRIQEDPHRKHNPTDPSSLTGLVPRPQPPKQLARLSSANLRSLHDRLKSLSQDDPGDGNVIRIFQDHRPKRQGDFSTPSNAVPSR